MMVKGESLSMIKHGGMFLRCESENHVPIVAERSKRPNTSKPTGRHKASSQTWKPWRKHSHRESALGRRRPPRRFGVTFLVQFSWRWHHCTVLGLSEASDISSVGLWLPTRGIRQRRARLLGADTVHRVLKVRHLTWCRGQQAKIHTHTENQDHNTADSMYCTVGKDLWEAFSGPATASQPETLVGWMRTAQDREGWRAAEKNYLAS